MLQDILKDKVHSMKTTNGDDLLAALGLERRRSSVQIIGSCAAIFGTGMILGAGIALLVAPKTGRALRQEIKTKASDYAERIGDKADEATSELRSALSLGSLEQSDKQKALQQDGKREPNAHQQDGKRDPNAHPRA